MAQSRQTHYGMSVRLRRLEWVTAVENRWSLFQALLEHNGFDLRMIFMNEWKAIVPAQPPVSTRLCALRVRVVFSVIVLFCCALVCISVFSIKQNRPHHYVRKYFRNNCKKIFCNYFRTNCMFVLLLFVFIFHFWFIINVNIITNNNIIMFNLVINIIIHNVIVRYDYY